jgi:hypothetical protein
MDEAAEDVFLGMVFDAARADAPLLVGLIAALVAEGVLPPSRVNLMFAQARGFIRHLEQRDLHASHLEMTGAELRSRLSELGHDNVPMKAPPDWWKTGV